MVPDDRKVIREVLSFWFEETDPKLHFKQDDDFDETVRARFEPLARQAAGGAFAHWQDGVEESLALILALDQFPRNIWRGTPAAFAQDKAALAAAETAVTCGHDLDTDEARRAFFYMPFMHAEDLAAQEKCVTLFEERLPAAKENQRFAILHRDIIRDFGRFPHRNRILGRETTPEEATYLDEGGFNPKA